MIQRQAITAKPVTKLYGFTICSVDTGWAENNNASTSIRLLSSWFLHPVNVWLIKKSIYNINKILPGQFLQE